VASVAESFTPRRGTVARGEAPDSIEGTILLRRGENPKTVLSAVHEAVTQINRDLLPAGMRIVPFCDRTKHVVADINRETTARYGIAVSNIEHTLESAFGGKLATVIVGGLIPATLLTMLVLPTFYQLADKWFGAGWQKRHPEVPEVP
jgi:cobalt-zinc-cadmium resistance protein CzcA